MSYGMLLRTDGSREYGYGAVPTNTAYERRLRMLITATHERATSTATAVGLLPNKGMKQTNLSAAPGTHTDRSAASCPRGTTDGGTGSQLIPGVLRTVLESRGQRPGGTG